MRLLVVLLLLAAVASLGYALSGLFKSTSDSGARLQRAMRLRIGLSIGVFLLLLALWQLGLIQPHGLAG
ncbi:MAG: DUF2909 family protein [Gammaproteobacteria bacterium]|nr:DUF2909 family protein [Gammaproteobacteria bacterium]